MVYKILEEEVKEREEKKEMEVEEGFIE